MKYTFLYSLLCLVFAQSQAQTWTLANATMGGRFENNIYYDLQKGVITDSSVNGNWDLAFFVGSSGQNNFSAAVRANHAQFFMGPSLARILVYSTHMSSADFSIVSYKDTITLDPPLWNDDTNYDIGAFNQNADSSNLFDFGWGKYNASNHNLYGDSVYLINRSKAYYKFIIDSLDGYTSTWYGRIAHLDSPSTTSFVINGPPNFQYANKNFVYYSLNNTIRDLEPPADTWDLQFTSFTDFKINPQGVDTPYRVNGPLLHRGHKSAILSNVYPDTADAMTAATQSYQPDVDLMANSWLYPGTTDTIGDLSYFIKPNDDSAVIYQVVFTEYDETIGSFDFMHRTFPNVTSVASLHSTVSDISLFPNPSTIGEVFVFLESEIKYPDVQITVTDIMGRYISNQEASISSGTSVHSVSTTGWSPGIYLLTLSASGHTLASSIFEVKN